MTCLDQCHSFSRSAVTNDLRGARVVARDKSADSEFWYSVSTTGVYCRGIERNRVQANRETLA